MLTILSLTILLRSQLTVNNNNNSNNNVSRSHLLTGRLFSSYKEQNQTEISDVFSQDFHIKTVAESELPTEGAVKMTTVITAFVASCS